MSMQNFDDVTTPSNMTSYDVISTPEESTDDVTTPDMSSDDMLTDRSDDVTIDTTEKIPEESIEPSTSTKKNIIAYSPLPFPENFTENSTNRFEKTLEKRHPETYYGPKNKKHPEYISEVLKQAYIDNNYMNPTALDRKKLAQQLGLTLKQISNWYCHGSAR
jgi:hypothetical protein